MGEDDADAFDIGGDGPTGSVDVAILGCGVVGLTTAIHLELAGYDTAVYADRLPTDGVRGPTFATPFAAASVKPSSVAVGDLSAVLSASQAAFRVLCEAASMGVRREPHFVLFEEDRPDPSYAAVVEDFERVDDDADHPRRSGAETVYGWRFPVYFVELPVFVARCLALYRALGGVVHERTLAREAFLDLPADVLANCAGLRARDLFDDLRPLRAYVGHQVLATGLPPIRDATGDVFSYAYTTGPGADDAVAGEVYAYPRTDALVLGGSRIPADVAPGEEWDGSIEGPTRTVDGVTVPARLLDLNADLLSGYAGVDLSAADLTARYGYRPVRDLEGEGVRIELEDVDGRPVVHNYGHGGAGVTLSWGSAAEVASLVRQVVPPDPGPIDVPPEFAVAERLAALVRH